ncbi:MAG: hypothetical protein V8T47_07560 [Oscillospiraceae bacterium]
MTTSEIENVPEGKGFYENLQPTEALEGGAYAYTESVKNSDGKIVFLPFEGGNADSIIAAAKAAGAVGVALYDPTPAEGEEYDYVNVELTNYDVPVARANLTEFELDEAQQQHRYRQRKGRLEPQQRRRRDVLVLVLGPDGRPLPEAGDHRHRR